MIGGKSGRVAGRWGFGLSVFYAVLVRFYQAAGGTIGVPGTFTEESLDVWYMANYVAGLLILLGGVACLFLSEPWVRTLPRRFPVRPGQELPRPLMLAGCVVPVLAGGVFAVAHGIVGIVTQLLELCGVIHVDYPSDWVTLDVTALNLWNVLFYEPWFVAMGICLILAALGYLRQAGIREVVVRRIVWTSYVLIFVLGVLGTLAVVLKWNVTVGG
ncbi:hypothetical protein [Streptomyces sindenensis]|uniref:hypothetical protein n=1 Tax=Streptomyces sindenensis TaxID=67363 RepID=UPI0016784EA8|nr:hypothetical protein [Streptomyces sindenensis]GGP46324.1 hypothetical protein GCM10010231_16780 [Streptomyces sindenensis]